MESLIKYWPLIIVVVGMLIAGAVTVKYKIPSLSKKIVDLEAVAHKKEVGVTDLMKLVKKTELYKDGRPLYLHKEIYDNFTKECQLLLCRKIDGIRLSIEKRLDAMDESREKARGEAVKTREGVAALATSVEALVARDQVEHIRAIAKIIVGELKG